MFNADLGRRGPGVLLRDMLRGDDSQINAVIRVIAAAAPDVLLLTGMDIDFEGHVTDRLAAHLTELGLNLPHRYAPMPNAGMPSGHDLDGDGRLNGPRDAEGYGAFHGASGMALLSRLPFDPPRNLSALRWQDLPDAQMPKGPKGLFPSEKAARARRLSSVGHWIVPIPVKGGRRLALMLFHATPPVFDGPEDANGLRNADETRIWSRVLDGWRPQDFTEDLVLPADLPVVMGVANADPLDGDGRKSAIRALIADPRLQDPRPWSPGAAFAGGPDGDGGRNRLQQGDPGHDTVDWPDGIAPSRKGEEAKTSPGPGNLRVSYILPSANLTVRASGVVWPRPDPASDPASDLAQAVSSASRHRLVWVDVAASEQSQKTSARVQRIGPPVLGQPALRR